MTHSRLLAYVYTVFLGLMITLFVGYGISTFYKPPTQPVLPAQLQNTAQTPTAERLGLWQTYNTQLDQYHLNLHAYNRNVALIATGIAILLVIVSLLSKSRLRIVANGILFGGIFTLIYGIIRAIISERSGYIFFIVTIGLMLTLYLGYERFMRKPRPRRIPVEMR